MKRWFWNVMIGIDQLANAAAGPVLNVTLRPTAARFGNPDETLSSVFGKNVQAGECRGCRLVCRVLNWIDPGHCETSIEKDESDPMPATEKPPEETGRRSGQSEATGLINP